jgi:hypothetical protein
LLDQDLVPFVFVFFCFVFFPLMHVMA